MMRTSPAAARNKTVAMKENITNGTPLRKPRGLLKAFTPSTMSTSASPTAIVSAATLIRRVHDDTGRTVVSAVPTKYTVMKPPSTFPSIEAVMPRTTMA